MCRRTLEDMFADFAEKPVASGSIAQIHKAHLSAAGAQNSDYPAGTTVAVKVCPLSRRTTSLPLPAAQLYTAQLWSVSSRSTACLYGITKSDPSAAC